jgi:lipopolysaccharide/colanic/teichoic acid biosynthesis glycosyltransferase
MLTDPANASGFSATAAMALAALKNVIDRSLAAIGLVIVSPLMLALACFIRVRMGKPVLLRQLRIGRGEKSFTFLKLRTMTEARDSRGVLLPDELRLTALGRFLRASSLDELPQLWNVLQGDMSLVGPRPLLPEYLARYDTHQRRRHEVKPGITGWAQINGRNALTWREKFDLDVWYVDHCSPWLDIKILWLTLLRVLHRDGISQRGHATMPEFMGTANVTGQNE